MRRCVGRSAVPPSYYSYRLLPALKTNICEIKFQLLVCKKCLFLKKNVYNIQAKPINIIRTRLEPRPNGDLSFAVGKGMLEKIGDKNTNKKLYRPEKTLPILH